jgi:RadC-like JAB domain-containing protein
MARRIPAGIQDFTYRETIYICRLRTMRLQIDPRVAASYYTLKTMGGRVDIAAILAPIFAQYDGDHEHVVLLILNPAREVVGFKLIASGAQDHVYVDRKVLMRAALLLGASGMMVAHNHPAGALEPSKHDVEFTAELIDSARHLDLDFVDHWIYMPNGTIVSIRERYPNLFPADPIAGDGP